MLRDLPPYLALGACLALGCSRSGQDLPHLAINEVMADNETFPFTDENGLHLDWVEIHNPNGFPVSLAGYTLSDRANQPRKYFLPPGERIEAHGFLVVFLVGAGDLIGADGEAIAFERTLLHADFALSPRSEDLYLFGGGGDALLDTAPVRDLPTDVAVGRYPDGQGAFGPIYLPTPGARNTPTGIKPVRWGERPSVQFSADCTEPLRVEFSLIQDAREPLPDVALSWLVLQGDCDFEAQGSFATIALCDAPREGDDCLRAVAESLEVENPACADPAGPPLEVDRNDGCRRDAAGRPLGEVELRETRFVGFLPPMECGTKILWRVGADDGIRALEPHRACLTYGEVLPTVVISEYQPANVNVFFRCTNCREGEDWRPAPDWLEIYNYGEQPVDLTGFGLVGRQAGDLFAWTFGRDTDFDPAMTVIGPGEYRVVLADDDQGDRRTYVHQVRSETGELVDDPSGCIYYSTRFRLDRNRPEPDVVRVVQNETNALIDSVVIDLREWAREQGQDINDPHFFEGLSVGRFPEETFPGAETEEERYPPNILAPGVVTQCPTPALAPLARDPERPCTSADGVNVLTCLNLPEPVLEVLVVPAELTAGEVRRCPRAGEAAVVRARVAFDADTPPGALDVELVYTAGDERHRLSLGAGVVLSRAPEAAQTLARPGMVLYDVEAEIPGQPAGTLVRFFLRARDRAVGGGWVRLDETNAPRASFRYLSGPPDPSGGLRINEVLPLNARVLLPGFDPLQSFQRGYVELYLPPDSPEAALDLNGFYLSWEKEPSDPLGEPRRLRLGDPARPEDLLLERGTFLLLVASRPPRQPPGELPESLAGYVYLPDLELDPCRQALHLIAPDKLGNCIAASIHWDFRSQEEIAEGLETCGESRPDLAVGRLTCAGQDRVVDLFCEACSVRTRTSPGAPNVLPPLFLGAGHFGAFEDPECADPLYPAPCGATHDETGLVRIRGTVLVDEFLVRRFGNERALAASRLDIQGAAVIQSFTERLWPCELEPLDVLPGYFPLGVQHHVLLPSGPGAPGVLWYSLEVEDGCGRAASSCPAEAPCLSLGTRTVAPPPLLRINEINRAAPLAGGDGQRPWIELYNASAEPVDLRGMSLSHNRNLPRLVEFTEDLVLDPGQVLLVITDGGPRLEGEGAPHHRVIDFPWARIMVVLDDGGQQLACRRAGVLYLYERAERGSCLVDRFPFAFPSTVCTPPRSLGRAPDGTGEIVELGSPSPGELNAPSGEGTFLRGDADLDGAISVSDAVTVLRFLFTGGGGPSCRDILDADDDGSLRATDAVFILNFLFRQGPVIPDPFPSAGTDPTPDDLPCPPATD